MTGRDGGSPAQKEPAWFEEWFGLDYLELYPHRDSREAAAAVSFIADSLRAAQIERVLDLACGAGRHSRLLAERWETTGFDLSAPLLRIARRDSPAARYARGDMRSLPFRDASFDLVVNLFTSFGYFERDTDHGRVFAELSRTVKPGGTFVLDYLNAPQVRRTLVPEDEKLINGIHLVQQRRISADGRFVEKSIIMREKKKRFTERVRLFEAAELTAMLSSAGFRTDLLVGDYAGQVWTEASPRALIFATRL